MNGSAKGGILGILRVPEIRAALFGTFVIMLGFGILLPQLPLYARSFGVGYGAVGVLVASFSSTRLVFDLVAGGLVARRGERAVATLGALVVGASSVLAAVAPTFTWLVIFRGAGGAGSSMFFAALLSYLLKAAPKEQVGRVMGIYYGTFNLGFIAGPLLGAPLAATFGLASPLWVYAAACFVAATLFWRSIRDIAGPAQATARGGGIRRIGWSRSFVTVLLAALAYAWVLSGVAAMVPLFATDRLGATATLGAIGITVWSIPEFAILYPAGVLTDRVGRKHVLGPALLGLIAVLVPFGLASAPWAFLGLLGLLGIFTGLGGVPPAVMLSDVVPADRSALATGVFRFASDVGFVLGPLVAGVSADAFGLGWAFAITAIPCTGALGLLLSIPDTRPVLRHQAD